MTSLTQEAARALKTNQRERLAFMLKNGADSNGLCDGGSTLLCLAVSLHGMQSSSQLIASLIAHGCKLDQPCTSGDTALTVALKGGLEGPAKMLLAAGANPSLAGANGCLPLTLAMALPEESCAEMVVLLLDHGADAQAFEQSHGRSLLHVAVEQSDPALVRQLLARGQDPRAVSEKTGEDASQAAARQQRSRGAPYGSSSRADVNETFALVRTWIECQAARDAVDAVTSTTQIFQRKAP